MLMYADQRFCEKVSKTLFNILDFIIFYELIGITPILLPLLQGVKGRLKNKITEFPEYI